jgi:hypothetical protein
LFAATTGRANGRNDLGTGFFQRWSQHISLLSLFGKGSDPLEATCALVSCLHRPGSDPFPDRLLVEEDQSLNQYLRSSGYSASPVGVSGQWD